MSQVNNTNTSPSNLAQKQLIEEQERANHQSGQPGKAHAEGAKGHAHAHKGGEHHHHGGGTTHSTSTPANTLTSPTSPFGDD